MLNKKVLGILGAGKLGTALGRLAIDAGYEVLMAGSGSTDKIALSVEVLVTGAKVMTKERLVSVADIILLALPLSKVDTIPEISKDKVVIDAMNYWWAVDGKERIPSNKDISSSEYVRDKLQTEKIVKAFNHMGYHDLEFESHANVPKVIAYAGDDHKTNEIVFNLIKDLGFEPLNLGALSMGSILEPGTDLFGANLTREEFMQTMTDIAIK